MSEQVIVKFVSRDGLKLLEIRHPLSLHTNIHRELKPRNKGMVDGSVPLAHYPIETRAYRYAREEVLFGERFLIYEEI